ncbi:MAG: vWA domain-containing protein [Bacteroidota bacterium]|nr:VWA domain-containing protein [Candidatus Kapabacteria bacterium]MDW8219637.1 vWA domain-containing protein [Bacteroidota bacterium]
MLMPRNLLTHNTTSNHQTREQEQNTSYAYHTLAQYAMTGCLDGVVYANPAFHAARLHALIHEQDSCISTEFLAQTAVYAHQYGYIHETPAVLAALLATRKETFYLKSIFPYVITTLSRLRLFVRIIRSGLIGRKSLGTVPKQLIQQWLAQQSDEQLLDYHRDTQKPSLADIIRIAHAKPHTPSRRALYASILHNKRSWANVQSYVSKQETVQHSDNGNNACILSASLPHISSHVSAWQDMIQAAPYHALYHFIPRLLQHGAHDEIAMVQIIYHITRRLLDTYKNSAHVPISFYPIIEAWKHTAGLTEEIGSTTPWQDPTTIYPTSKRTQSLSLYQALDALRAALEHVLVASISSLPKFHGKTYICIDASGSMQLSMRHQHSTHALSASTRYIDIAALFAYLWFRAAAPTDVLPFEQHAVPQRIHAEMTLAEIIDALTAINGGGTNCSAALKYLNQHHAQGMLVIFISDNQSWLDPESYRSAALLHEWQIFKIRNPLARLVCLDIQPHRVLRPHIREDILHVSGLSESVLRSICAFASGTLYNARWIEQIRDVELSLYPQAL